MTYTEIVTKIVGPIRPVGKTETDEERYENLKAMCELVNQLVSEIDSVAYNFKDAGEFSKKRASKFAEDFLTNILGITN